MKWSWIISGILILVIVMLSLIIAETMIRKQRKEAINANPTLEFSQIILVDTFKNELSKDKVSSVMVAEFYPIYLGRWQDSILLNYEAVKTDQIKYNTASFKNSIPKDIIIWIDTTRIIGSGHLSMGIPYQRSKMLDTTKWFFRPFRVPISSYPVFIYNHSSKLVPIAFGNYLPIYLEAQDSAGIWREIQVPPSRCGTGTYTYMKAADMVLTTCPLFEGNYETNLRLAFSTWYGKIPNPPLPIHSNSFRGTINYSQFEY
jgi:hypothetical protein